MFRSTDGGESWNPVNRGLNATSIRAIAVDPIAPANLYAGTTRGVFKSAQSGETWTHAITGLTTPGNYAIAVDPQMTSTVYAGSNGSGIYKSVDGGDEWFHLDGLGWHVISSIAIDPDASAVIYAGTPSHGIYKSTDGGVTWNSINSGLISRDVRHVAVDPQVTNTLYAGFGRDIWGPAGLFKTNDGGNSWFEAGLVGSSISAVAVDPQASRTVYAASDLDTSDDPARIGVYKSTDGGGSWTAVNDGLTNRDVHALAIDPHTPTTIFAGTSGGVFRSMNGGASWTAMNDGLTSRSIRALTIDPRAPANLYAGTAGGVFRINMTPWFTLRVSTEGIGRGRVTSNPPGIDCGADCSEKYVEATTVTLTATPAQGSIFMGWTGCDAVSRQLFGHHGYARISKGEVPRPPHRTTIPILMVSA